ncbi:MAG: hypothetical protein H0X17_01645 [Deltaproteobacteria bacterium]|nr:hypothetical protein [Deltaproteobacteria bacterium]
MHLTRPLTLPAVALLALVACGDNLVTAPDAPVVSRCAPPEQPLPTEGMLADPLALTLSPDCVVGGLGDLPGRWFVADPTSTFSFSYPKLEGSCDTGFRRAFFVEEDDHDLEDDGFTFHTWSDGTRAYYRYNYRFQISDEETFEFAYAFAACLLPDGTMSAVEARYDTDRGVRETPMTGKRFGRKDGLATGLELVGELGTWGAGQRISAYNVAVDGAHAYVVGPEGLEVIDVSNPAQPTHVGHIDGEYNDVKLVRGAGKVAAYLAPIPDQGTRIVDVTVPTAPTLAVTLPEYSHSVFLDRSAVTPALYLATYTNTVPRYDVTNPLAPLRLGATTLPGEEAGVHDLYVAGDHIYANNTTAGLVVVDVAGGLATPVERGRVAASYSHASWAGTAGGRPIVLHGDEGMTGTAAGGAFLRVLDGDLTSAGFLGDIGRYQSRLEVGIHNFQLVGDRVYIAYYQDGVRVVDLADPTRPTEIAHYNTWDPVTGPGGAFEGALGVTVVGDLIYVADSERGLLILRATE